MTSPALPFPAAAVPDGADGTFVVFFFTAAFVVPDTGKRVAAAAVTAVALFVVMLSEARGAVFEDAVFLAVAI